MKKIGMCVWALAALLCGSCAKSYNDPYYPDALGGHDDLSENPLCYYMLDIADQLITDALSELETALVRSDRGQTESLYYLTDGQPLTEPGAVWILRRDSRLQGLVIRKEAASAAWTLEFEGGLALRNRSYPTHYRLQAVRVDQLGGSHGDWQVSLQGDRTENGGYSCHFETPASMRYLALGSEDYWNAYGLLQLDVFLHEKQIDKAMLSLEGGRSSIEFVRGL